MQPQGEGPLNTAYFESLIAQIDKCNRCPDLQALVTKAFASLNAQVSAIDSQASAIYGQASAIATVVTNLVQNPTLGNAVTCIQTLYASGWLPAQYAAYANYILKLAAIPAQITALTSAIESAAGRLKSCTITVPTITLPTLPSLPPLP